MSTPVLPVEELIAPISEDKPAGEDVSLLSEWQAINEARRADKLTGRQNTDWRLLFDVLTDCLAHKGKDLRLGMWLTEASVKLYGFAGLRDSFRVLSGLISNFWDKGLYPEADGGDLQFRAMPLVWMTGEKLPDAIREIPLTARADSGKDYSYLDYRMSRRVGSEKDLLNANGDIDESRQQRRQAELAAGGVSVEMFEEAVKATKRKTIEPLAEVLDEALAEFKALDKLIDERFGNEAPGTSEARESFEDCRRVVLELVRRKREEEPDQQAAAPGSPEAPERAGDGQPSARPGLGFDAFPVDGGAGGSWAKAEELIRSGKINEGLAEMTRQSAQEYGRVRFQHRLRLAEICMSTNRVRLGVAILEELARQIDEFKLDAWESPELLGRVWGRLYKSYKGEEPGSDRAARGAALFDRLCRLDPWQALRWDE
jgi:type VI secretion system protein ImpA